MRTFKFNLATLLQAQSEAPGEYLCFTISKMAESTSPDPDSVEYPHGMEVIDKFRELLPEHFKPKNPDNEFEIITSHVTGDFARSANGRIRLKLVQLAFERHGFIDLEFEIDTAF